MQFLKLSTAINILSHFESRTKEKRFSIKYCILIAKIDTFCILFIFQGSCFHTTQKKIRLNKLQTLIKDCKLQERNLQDTIN